MKTKILFTSIIALSSFENLYAHTDLNGVNSSASGASVSSMEMPILQEGVTIVSPSEAKALSKSLRVSDGFKKALTEYKKNGYVKRKSDDAIQLLSTSKPLIQDKYYYSHESQDTHLKQSLSQITLAFPHEPLSFVKDEDNLGFAAAMTYNNGWTGVGQYFRYKPIGVCHYLKTSVSLNHSAIQLNKDTISFFINNKPAVAINEGRDEEGYSYIINWYDNDYFHKLNCASEKIDLNLAEETKKLAYLIDKK